jgi:glycosyltransferase involved in cell wall biosynthesis
MTDAQRRPIVSVVIPCFNQAQFLRAAVASVRAQTYRDCQCIVVNDGSTDDTAAVATSLRVRTLDQPNRGLSEARNAGLAIAAGELVVFLDADDELLPAAIGCGVDALAANPDADAVVGRCQAIEVDGRLRATFQAPIDPAHLYDEWLRQNFVWTPGAAMFRRRALAAIGGFPARLGPAADYAVYLRLARERRVRFVDEALVRYRQHDTSMSRDPALMLRATLEVLRRERRAAPAATRGQIRCGWSVWCEWYGEQIVDRLRDDWHRGRFGRDQLRAALTLVRYRPGLALRHLARKLNAVVAHAVAARRIAR